MQECNLPHPLKAGLLEWRKSTTPNGPRVKEIAILLDCAGEKLYGWPQTAAALKSAPIDIDFDLSFFDPARLC